MKANEIPTVEEIHPANLPPLVLRKILLRVVFWALGLAACFGAAGVIFAVHDTLWRIVGTCAATAIGALVVLRITSLLEFSSTWTAGTMAVVLAVIEYLAILGLIWEFFGSADDQVGLTMLFLALTGMPAIVFWQIRERPETSVSARLGLGASPAVFLMLMIGVWGAWLAGLREGRWQNLGLSLGIFSVLAMLCLVGTGTDQRFWRWLGVTAAGIAWAMSTYAILLDLHETSTFFVCAISVACVVAHANVIVRCPLKPGQQWLMWGTIGAAMAAAAFIDLSYLTRPWQEETFGRLAGAAAIIAGCGTIALLVLTRINQRVVSAASRETACSSITWFCPRCAAKQTMAIGRGKCEACGLTIEVRVS
jgi:hypothetical protein